MAAARGARIAVGQMCSTASVADNLESISKLAARAAAEGAAMLFLPEASYAMGVSAGDADVLSQVPMAKDRLGAIARDSSLWISVGGHAEAPGADDGRVDNVHFVFGPDGTARAAYAKTHLFDATTAAGVLRESEHTRPGTELVALRGTPVGTLGLMTCYDARFPRVSERLRFEAGASVLAVPSAFTVPTGAAHWELLMRCRAVETQCYVVAAAQWGDHGGGRRTWGHTMVVDPWGTVVAQCGEGADELIFADISDSVVRGVREAMPLESQRREDLYQRDSASLRLLGELAP